MIKLVSYTKNKNIIDISVPEWYYIPRYADRLEGIGKVGIVRTLHYGALNKIQLMTPGRYIPKTETEIRTLNGVLAS